MPINDQKILDLAAGLVASNCNDEMAFASENDDNVSFFIRDDNDTILLVYTFITLDNNK